MHFYRRIGASEVNNIENITITDDTLTVELTYNPVLSVPLDWYPRLLRATPEERNYWDLKAESGHIHWKDLDEDISVESLLASRRSSESEVSFRRWLEARKAGRGVKLHELRSK